MRYICEIRMSKALGLPVQDVGTNWLVGWLVGWLNRWFVCEDLDKRVPVISR